MHTTGWTGWTLIWQSQNGAQRGAQYIVSRVVDWIVSCHKHSVGTRDVTYLTPTMAAMAAVWRRQDFRGRPAGRRRRSRKLGGGRLGALLKRNIMKSTPFGIAVTSWTQRCWFHLYDCRFSFSTFPIYLDMSEAACLSVSNLAQLRLLVAKTSAFKFVALVK